MVIIYKLLSIYYKLEIQVLLLMFFFLEVKSE